MEDDDADDDDDDDYCDDDDRTQNFTIPFSSPNNAIVLLPNLDRGNRPSKSKWDRLSLIVTIVEDDNRGAEGGGGRGSGWEETPL